MAKKLTWDIKTEETEHKVELVYSMLSGKAIVTIDGDEFDISVGFMKLRGTNQVFKLGEDAAILDFPKKGEPNVIIDGVCLKKTKNY